MLVLDPTNVMDGKGNSWKLCCQVYGHGLLAAYCRMMVTSTVCFVSKSKNCSLNSCIITKLLLFIYCIHLSTSFCSLCHGSGTCRGVQCILHIFTHSPKVSSLYISDEILQCSECVYIKLKTVSSLFLPKNIYNPGHLENNLSEQKPYLTLSVVICIKCASKGKIYSQLLPRLQAEL